jgi:hypothetical protein
VTTLCEVIVSEPAAPTVPLLFSGTLALLDTPTTAGVTLRRHDGPLTDHPEGIRLGVPLLVFADFDGDGWPTDGPRAVGTVTAFAIDGDQLIIGGHVDTDTPDGQQVAELLEAGPLPVGMATAQDYTTDPAAPDGEMWITNWRITHVVAETGLSPEAVGPWGGMMTITAAQSSPADGK